MIVPMKKVCLMVQESSTNDTLVKLREAGVMHLCTDKKSIDTGTGNMTGMIERKKQISNAIWLLDEAKKKKTETRKTEAKNTVTEKIDSSVLLENIVNFGRERKELQSRIAFIKREITRIEKWGDFSPASVNELSNDIPVFFYEIKSNVFTMFPEDINYIKLGNGKAHSGASIQILVLEKEIPSGLIPGLLPFRLPEKSLSEFLDEVNEINIRLNSIQESLNSYVTNSDALVKEKIIVEQEIEYENAVCSMKNVELSALVSNNTEVSDISPDNSSINNSSIDDPPLIEHSFSYLTGYVPKDDMESLKKTAIREKWALSADDPEEADEKVPTKLKNNKFVSLVNPVTGFLGIVPGYREVDISAWFLIFFCIFFFMIFGDAVY
jgi:V/A-type H+-transporting ATPase subunit I